MQCIVTLFYFFKWWQIPVLGKPTHMSLWPACKQSTDSMQRVCIEHAQGAKNAKLRYMCHQESIETISEGKKENLNGNQIGPIWAWNQCEEQLSTTAVLVSIISTLVGCLVTAQWSICSLSLSCSITLSNPLCYWASPQTSLAGV